MGSLGFLFYFISLFFLDMGWTYNTVNPDAPTNAPTIVGVGVTFTTFSLIVVALRIYVRKFLINAIAIGRSSTSTRSFTSS